jgi:hypothetical protein
MPPASPGASTSPEHRIATVAVLSMLPTFLGLGAPKAATTWLFRCLQEHPEVFVADVKETEFFSWRHTMIDLDDYAAYFDGANAGQAVGEITTSYLYWDGTAERAHRAVPDARLFVSLRNPMDQVYSHYWHLRRQNFHQDERPRPERFEDALDLYPDKLLKPARYAEHLARWLSYFDRDQLHLIFYDDIQSRPAQVLRALYAFLGVDATVRPSSLQTDDQSVRRGSSPKTRCWSACIRPSTTGLPGTSTSPSSRPWARPGQSASKTPSRCARRWRRSSARTGTRRWTPRRGASFGTTSPTTLPAWSTLQPAT